MLARPNEDYEGKRCEARHDTMQNGSRALHQSSFGILYELPSRQPAGIVYLLWVITDDEKVQRAKVQHRHPRQQSESKHQFRR